MRWLSDDSVGNAASLDDFEGRFAQRLTALARVQVLPSQLSTAGRVEFDEFLRSIRQTEMVRELGKPNNVPIDLAAPAQNVVSLEA